MSSSKQCELAEKAFAFRQRQTDLIGGQPNYVPLDPSHLNGLDLSQAALSLWLYHPFHLCSPTPRRG